MPDNLDPSDAELEMIVDEARQKTGKPPAKRTAEKGIADMQARLKLLSEQKSLLLKRLDTTPRLEKYEPILKEISQVDKEICEAEQRLTEFRTQLSGLN